MKARGWWVVVVLLLAAMATALVTSARLENQTWDEAIHLTSGYTYLRLGSYRLSWENPPLGKLLCAAPLLAASLRLPTEHESWRNGDTVMFSAIFLYRNFLKPDTLLLLGRLPTMALTLLLGLALALWTRKHFGPAVAVLALFFYALDPNFTAHGHYVTTDLIAALTAFLAVAAWTRFLLTKRWPDLIWAGLALGLALASKYSLLVLLVLLPLLYLVRWWQQPQRYCIRHLLASHAALVALSGVIILLVYLPDSTRRLAKGNSAPLAAYATQSNFVSRALRFAGERLHVPPHAYLLGVNVVARHNESGNPAYLLGTISEKGRWYYFPVAMAVKTPTAVLLLLLLAAAGGIPWLARGGLPAKLRAAPFPWLVALIAPLAYLGFTMFSDLNLGLRHVLPVYPFLFVVAAATLWRHRHWALITLVLAVQVWEYANIAPDFLAFFNTPAGGAEHGLDYLADSNLDWGQDIKKLARYRAEHGIGKLKLAYFGTTDVNYYLGPHERIDASWPGGSGERLDSVVVISATLLTGLYGAGNRFAWFRRREPDARIGHSLYVYDLRKEAR